MHVIKRKAQRVTVSRIACQSCDIRLVAVQSIRKFSIILESDLPLFEKKKIAEDRLLICIVSTRDSAL